MKRFFTFLIFAILLGNSAMAADFSAVCSTGQTLYYNITSYTEPYTVEIVRENTSSPYYTTYPTGDLEIPESVEYNSIIYTVTSIESFAFLGCNGLTSVTIGNSVTSIGDGAFSGCSGLTSVTIGNSVTSIGDYAFRGCSGLTSVTIPSLVTSIGVEAFKACSGLSSIIVDTDNQTYDSRDNCNAIIKTGTNTLIAGCMNTIIPNSVTRIDDYAFYECSGLTSVTIPNSITSIGYDAFMECVGLTGTLTIPNSVISIEECAFCLCSGLDTVIIGSSVEYIGFDVFGYCDRLTTLYFNATECFSDNPGSNFYAITTLNIGENVTHIPAFPFNRVQTINFNAINCTYVGNSYEEATGLIPSDGNSNDITLNIGENVRNIPNYAFMGCSGLASITIPNSVISIGNCAFKGCTGLSGSLAIPNSVTHIGSEAFSNCSGLASITIPNSVTSIGQNAFKGTGWYNSQNAGILYLDGWCLEYNGTPLITTLEIADGTRGIADGTFSNCRHLTSVTIPNSVTHIGKEVFSNCRGLTSVTIPNSVTSIGDGAFNGCSGLAEVNFNATNCTGIISTSLFDSDNALSKITIGENVTRIPNNAFRDCVLLDSIICRAEVPPLIFGLTFDFNLISNIPVIVPCGAVETYNNADFWYSFQRIQQDASCPAQYTITALSNNPNYGTVTGGGVYLENATATLTATPYEEHTFVSWNDGSTDNPREITVTGDSTFIATFVRNNINPTIYTEFSASACGNYTWNGTVYTESGDHIQTFTAANTADSIVTLHLTVHPLPQPEITVDGILDACNPETTSVTLSAGDYSEYIWSNGETSSSIVVTSAGNYFVEVVDEHGCHGYSEETSVGYSTILTEAPQIKGVGIGRSGGNVIEWRVNSTEGIAGFEIYREDNVANAYTLVMRVERPGQRSCIDQTANPSARAYRYKVCAIDECGGMSPMSEPHKSVHLTINRGIGDNWNLIWSQYEGLDFPSYKIYRGTSLQDMIVIGEVSSNFNSFTDSDNPYNTGFFYQIEVVRNSSSRDGDEEVSLRSNIVDNGYFQEHTIIAVSYNPLQGTVTGGGTYPEGYLVTLTANAAEGYTFVSWNDGNTDNPREITVTGDAMYVASFAEISQETRYTVSVISANPSQGSVIGGGTYTEGSVVTIAAIANNGYLFGSWSDGNTDNPREITVTCDTTYVASFVPVTGIEENTNLEISLFPNPATDIINISSSETISEIEIVNTLGQVVKRIEVNADNAVCDVEDLTSGVYVVRIRTLRQAQGAALRKFIKE